MAHIVLFHHVLGLTPGVRQLADAFIAVGLEVSTPDLFDGQTFPDVASGLQYVSELGDEALFKRAEQACWLMESDVVYAGLSLGVVTTQYLVNNRPGVRGALLIHGFVDPNEMPGAWPVGCPAGVFGMQDDPYLVGDGDLEAARQWAQTHAGLEIHLYPGTGHLFTEPALDDYDPDTTRRLVADAAGLVDRWTSS